MDYSLFFLFTIKYVPVYMIFDMFLYILYKGVPMKNFSIIRHLIRCKSIHCGGYLKYSFK